MKAWVAAVFLTAGAVEAHTVVSTLYIDGKSQGDGTCVRQNTDMGHPNWPVIDYTSNDVACGFAGTTPVAYTCPASAGAKLSFEYREVADTAGSGAIDSTHKGSCAVYAKQLASSSDSASGSGWFKVWSEGYDMDKDLWCTEKLIKNNGFLSVDVPPALPSGNWLFRTELIAMHNTTPTVEPQFYVNCAQVFIESDISAALDIPSEYEVSIPGYITVGEDSMTYNIYDEEKYANPKVAYPEPGPPAYNPPVPIVSANGKVTMQSTGGLPSDCLIKNDNWCAVAVPSYSDQRGCWAAVDDCWAQSHKCYAAARAVGSKHCQEWDNNMCQTLNSACNAADYVGPPTVTFTNLETYATILPNAVNAGEAVVTAKTSTQSGSTTSSRTTEATEATVITSSFSLSVSATSTYEAEAHAVVSSSSSSTTSSSPTATKAACIKKHSIKKSKKGKRSCKRSKAAN